MTVHKLLCLALGLGLAMLAGSSLAAGYLKPVPAPGQPEGIVFDAASGNYIITYEAEDEIRPRGMYQTIYVPPNKINPVLNSKFKLTPNGDIAYRYALKNGKDSQQSIGIWGLLVTSAKGATISTITPKYLQSQPTAGTALALSADARKVTVSAPAGWVGRASPNFGGTGLNVDWSFDRKHATDGLAPGKSLGGFGYESADLPGVGLAGMRGRTPTLAFAGHGPGGEVNEQLNEIKKKTSGVTRPAAVPTFFVATPFNAAALLERLQHHAKVDLVKFQLIDQAFAASLDPWFHAAIDAAKRGNTEGVRYQIKELRRLLKQEHHDADKEDESDENENEKKSNARIDKLAARVLDFDLKYIDKRLEGEKD